MAETREYVYIPLFQSVIIFKSNKHTLFIFNFVNLNIVTKMLRLGPFSFELFWFPRNQLKLAVLTSFICGRASHTSGKLHEGTSD